LLGLAAPAGHRYFFGPFEVHALASNPIFSVEVRDMSELAATALAMVAEGKGLLAADESGPTIKKRFDSIGVDSTEDRRRAYREMLFSADGVNEFVSGVILYDETIRQKSASGTPLPELLAARGILPGI
jgi:fructose-bisphosphate aldolase class I